MNVQSNSMKVGLLGATFSTGNLGVSALTAGIVKCVIHEIPKADIFLLDYGREAGSFSLRLTEGAWVIPLLNMRFSKNIFQKNHILRLLFLALVLKIIPISSVKPKLISKNVYLKSITDANILASIAAGDSFSDIYGLFRLLYISLPMILVLWLDKKLVLLPQTIGPFHTWIGKKFARYILTRATIIYSRDYLGLKTIQALIPSSQKQIRFCYDVGFVLDPIKPQPLNLHEFFQCRQAAQTVVGFNISGLLYMGGYTHNNMFGLKIDYIKLVDEILHLLLAKPEIIVLLIPHVFGFKLNSESDEAISERIYTDLNSRFAKRIFKISGRYNQNEIKYVIGLCEFFIGSRMHACIAALSQNIPAVAVAYSQKFIGVMETIGLEHLVADPRKMELHHILNLLDAAYSDRHTIQQQLSEKIPKVKNQVLGLFHEIREALE